MMSNSLEKDLSGENVSIQYKVVYQQLWRAWQDAEYITYSKGYKCNVPGTEASIKCQLF